MSSAALSRFHHLFLALLAVFVAVALYRFATHLFADLPWHLLPLLV